MSLTKLVKHLFHPQRSNNHRPRVLHPEALLSFALIAAGFWLALNPVKYIADQTGNVLGYASNITASQVVAKTNQERATQGLGALTANDQLNNAAMAKAQYMFAHQFWAHFAPDGTSPWKFFHDAGYSYSVAGENLARDFSNTDDMMHGWMNSPTHRENIMNPRYHDIGVAVVDGKLLGTDTTLVVQLFGTRSGGSAPKPKITQAAAKQVTATSKPTPTPVAVLSATSEQPSASQTPAPSVQPQEETIQAATPASPTDILGSAVLPVSALKSMPIFSPLQLTKAVFLAIIFMIAMTLVYDSFVMRNRNTVRLVGKNFAHLLLFTIVAFLLLLFKGGVIS